MSRQREKFATQVDSALLADIRGLAGEEGRQIQALVEEALADLVAKRRGLKPRAHVMAAYEDTIARYDAVYRKLAQ